MRRGMAIASFLVMLAGCGSGVPVGTSEPSTPAASIDDGISSATPTPVSTPVEASEAPPATPTVATEEPTATPDTSQQDLAIVNSGWSRFKGKYDSGQQLGYGITVKNPNPAWVAQGVDVAIDFLDKTGGVVDTVDETFAAILPGQTVAWADVQSDFAGDWTQVAKMEVTLAEPDWLPAEGAYGKYTFTKIAMRRDTLGDLTVTARLNSTFAKELENPQAVAVFYRAGRIVGGGYTFVEHARDGAAVKVTTSYSGKADKVELYGVLTSLSLISQ